LGVKHDLVESFLKPQFRVAPKKSWPKKTRGNLSESSFDLKCGEGGVDQVMGTVAEKHAQDTGQNVAGQHEAGEDEEKPIRILEPDL
jgi:hypothetical protein